MTAKNPPANSTTTIGRRTLLALGAAAGSALALGGGEAQAAAAPRIKITVLYGAPTSPDDFEKYYAGSHMPKVYKVKGISRIELAKPGPGPDGKPPAFYRITELWFSSAAQLKRVSAKPDWQAIVADVPNFATGGATILVSEIEPR
jgi:uncharacterized protein (TIGR02118 family)